MCLEGKAVHYIVSYRWAIVSRSQTAFPSFAIGSETKGSGEMQCSSFVVAITSRFWEFYCTADKGSRTARTAHDGFTLGFEATCVILIDRYCAAFTRPFSLPDDRKKGDLAVQDLYKNRNAFGTTLKAATTIAIWWSCLEVIATVVLE